MLLTAVSFLAGVLTVLAPCVFVFLPVILTGSIDTNSKHKSSSRPLIVAASVFVSVIVFTLLLKASTVLIGVPDSVWQYISGGLIILLGAAYLGVFTWKVSATDNGLISRSNKALAQNRNGGTISAIITGAALGPVFNSCSPTYAFIVAAVLPVSIATGMVYLISYALGMALVLLVLAYAGESIVRRFSWLTNPNGAFKKIAGLLFIVIGIIIITGTDKVLQTNLLEAGLYDWMTGLEDSLRQR